MWASGKENFIPSELLGSTKSFDKCAGRCVLVKQGSPVCLTNLLSHSGFSPPQWGSLLASPRPCASARATETQFYSTGVVDRLALATQLVWCILFIAFPSARLFTEDVHTLDRQIQISLLHTLNICFTLIPLFELFSCVIFVILREPGRLESTQAHLSLEPHSFSPSRSLVISRFVSFSPCLCKMQRRTVINTYHQAGPASCLVPNNSAVTGGFSICLRFSLLVMAHTET